MPILDQGYQHWSGTVSGHAWRWLAITRQGVRIAMRSWVLRLALIVSLIPALLLAAALCIWGLLEQQPELIQYVRPMLGLLGFVDPTMLKDPTAFRADVWRMSFDRFLVVQQGLSMVLILIAGPALISQDLRYNALPLYLSRPLRRIDYFVGKLGVIVMLIGGVTVAPVIVAYLLGVIFSLDLRIVPETFGLLLAGVAYGLIIAVSAGMLVLALSSLSRNSRFVALFWLAIWSGTGIVSITLLIVAEHQRSRQAWHDGEFHRDEYAAAKLAASQRDWRPLTSYNANLRRVGRAMLGTDAVWEKLSKIQPESERNAFLNDHAGPQYPWQWSALVLAAIFSLSAWILSRSIKTLDRLK